MQITPFIKITFMERERERHRERETQRERERETERERERERETERETHREDPSRFPCISDQIRIDKSYATIKILKVHILHIDMINLCTSCCENYSYTVFLFLTQAC